MSDTERDMIELTPAAAPAPDAVAVAPGGTASEGAGDTDLEAMTVEIVKALKTVYDPEIPVDIYELGLIYKVDLETEGDDAGHVDIDMTLTAPGCPVAGEMPIWVENAVRDVEGVESVKVNMTFDPPWTPERMSDEAKLELGWM
jgi:FeS assembly SUF system protein